MTVIASEATVAISILRSPEVATTRLRQVSQ